MWCKIDIGITLFFLGNHTSPFLIKKQTGETLLRLNRKDLIDKAAKIALSEVNYGWDKENGGIFYFLVRKVIRLRNWNGTKNSSGCISKRLSPC